MKFMPKEPLTVMQILNAYCTHETCSTCAIHRNRNGAGLPCKVFCEQYPQEAAKIMGFEIVDKDRSTVKERPLGEWTLREAKDYCNMGDSCTGCLFRAADSCKVGHVPSLWDLQPKPRFTEQDIEAAKAIKLLFPGCETIVRIPKGIELTVEEGGKVRLFNNNLLPSINHIPAGIDEILADGQKKED